MDSTLNKYRKNMKVYFQVLPPKNSCWENVKISDDLKTIFVRSSQDFGRGVKPRAANYWKFETDGVLNNMKQQDIFNTIIKPSLKFAFMGVDLLIFAYGQTGSGKSTTINGLLNNFDNRGITPRIISEMFSLKEEYKYETKVKFQISFVETFKNYITDLINYENGNKIRTPFKNICIKKIESESEGLKYLFQGEGRRKLKENDEYYSNIATSIYTIFVKSASKILSNPVEKYGKIHIIDMSGIDTHGNISCQLKNVFDIGSANLNKTQLEYCLLVIQKDKSNNVMCPGPLISYLGDALSARSLTIFLGHIRSNKEDLRITLSALQFANTVKKIKHAKLKTSLVTSIPLLTKHLQNKLDIIQEQVYLNSMLQNDDLCFNLTQNRVEQVQHGIDEYIKDKTNEISILNVTDAIIALNIFRDICCKLEIEKQEALEKLQALSSKTKVVGPKSSIVNKVPDHKPALRAHKKSNKKLLSDNISKASRHSTTKEVNPAKPGITLGHLLSANYQGDATKSLILKSKQFVKQLSQTNDLNSKTSDQMYSSISDCNLNDVESNNTEQIWNLYKKDMNYNYEGINSVLDTLILSSKELLTQYNILIDLLNKKIDIIDFKKYDLLKITLYQGMTSLQCTTDMDETKHINETKDRLANNIVELMKDTIDIKEDILTLLADLKVMVQEYHRNKKELEYDFAEYCINTFHVKMPCGEEIFEGIEDVLAVEPKKDEIIDIPNPIQNLFIKYQNILKRNRLLNNNILN